MSKILNSTMQEVVVLTHNKLNNPSLSAVCANYETKFQY